MGFGLEMLPNGAGGLQTLFGIVPWSRKPSPAPRGLDKSTTKDSVGFSQGSSM
jgi:hypothetical protein